MDVPSSFWETLVVFFGSLTVYFGVLTRNAKKNNSTERRHTPVEIDYVVLQEHLRKFIDERAEHKARNITNEFLGRIGRLENDMIEIREERKILYKLMEGVESLKEMVSNNSDQFLKLTESVARLQGAQDASR